MNMGTPLSVALAYGKEEIYKVDQTFKAWVELNLIISDPFGSIDLITTRIIPQQSIGYGRIRPIHLASLLYLIVRNVLKGSYLSEKIKRLQV